jgi:hypothetical protein
MNTPAMAARAMVLLLRCEICATDSRFLSLWTLVILGDALSPSPTRVTVRDGLFARESHRAMGQKNECLCAARFNGPDENGDCTQAAGHHQAKYLRRRRLSGNRALISVAAPENFSMNSGQDSDADIRRAHLVDSAETREGWRCMDAALSSDPWAALNSMGNAFNNGQILWPGRLKPSR